VNCAGTPINSVINIVYDNILRGAEALPIPTDAFPAFLHPKVEICFSRNPLTTEHIDVYVVPAVSLPLHHEFQSPQPCSVVPVIAYGPESLLALAFDCGCCDYLRSPWALEELRVRALRALPPRQLEFEWGTISLERGLQGDVLCLREPPAAPDHTTHPDHPAQLTLSAPEAAILRLLIFQSGSPVSRECLQAGLQRKPGKMASGTPPVTSVVGSGGLGDSGGGSVRKPSTTNRTTNRNASRTTSRSVDVHISSLRKKFNLLSGKALQPHPIRSIYGYGYMLIHKHSTPYSCCG